MNNDRRKQLQEAMEKLEDAKTIIECVRDEEQESFDNMPEGLQSSERGEKMETAISTMDTVINVAYEKMQEALMYCKGVIREMQFGGSAELSSEAIKRAEDALLNAEALQTQNKYDLEKELIGYKAAYEEECRKVEYWRSLLLKTERHLNNDCWYWQHDGQDKLSSMVDSLPVVISASELRELIAAGVHHES